VLVLSDILSDRFGNIVESFNFMLSGEGHAGLAKVGGVLKNR